MGSPLSVATVAVVVLVVLILWCGYRSRHCADEEESYTGTFGPNEINDYWKNRYYAMFLPGAFSRLRYDDPGFYTGSNHMWALRPGLRVGPTYGLWNTNNGNNYFVNGNVL